MASGVPGQWALPTTGTGIIGAPGAPAFGGRVNGQARQRARESAA